MFQELCLEKVSWDEELQGSGKPEYNAFLSKLWQMKKYRQIPRNLFSLQSVQSYHRIVFLTPVQMLIYPLFIYVVIMG